MRIEQLMSKDVQFCRSNDTLEQAASMMWDHDCGCLPVCSDDGAMTVMGMLTDRDIALCALFEGLPLRDLCVSQAMESEVRVCLPSQSLAEAESIMGESKVRRLPVVDGERNLVGLISLADLAQNASREPSPPGKNKGGNGICQTLAAICSPYASAMSPTA